ncbi:MAG: hypothetical protein AAGC79_16020, partial [Pseudomonadota bacterium]
LSSIFSEASEADFRRTNIEMNATLDIGLFGSEILFGEESLTKIPGMFMEDRIVLNIPGYENVGLYFNEQDPSFVPVRPESEAARYLPTLVGLTNQQLQDRFGISFSDAIEPSNAVADPLVSGGTIGTPLPALPTYPPQPDGFWLDYFAALGIDVSRQGAPAPDPQAGGSSGSQTGAGAQQGSSGDGGGSGPSGDHSGHSHGMGGSSGDGGTSAQDDGSSSGGGSQGSASGDDHGGNSQNGDGAGTDGGPSSEQGGSGGGGEASSGGATSPGSGDGSHASGPGGDHSGHDQNGGGTSAGGGAGPQSGGSGSEGGSQGSASGGDQSAGSQSGGGTNSGGGTGPQESASGGSGSQGGGSGGDNGGDNVGSGGTAANESSGGGSVPADPGPAPASSGQLEIGSVTVQQSSPDQWFSVTFSQAIPDARVVMGPLSHNGGDPAFARVRNVDETGFEFQVEEWDYLDGWHVAETISWMAMTAGSHTLPTGQTITAGRVTAANTDAVTVDLSGFTETPAVFAQVTSGSGPNPVMNRVDKVSTTGFSVRMQEEEGLDQFHVPETIDWIAVDASIGGSVALDAVDHSGTTFDFDLSGNEAIFAAMQTENGSDPAVLRVEATDASAFIFVDEEQSRDRETWHVEEQVAVFVSDIGTYDLA